MAKYVLTVTLNPALDKIVSIPNFRLGKDFVQKDASLSPGGKGINVSRALKHLGVPALATGLIGGSTGKFIQRSLTLEHIPNDFSYVSFETRISLTINDPVRNMETRILDPGQNVPAKDFQQFDVKFRSLLRRAHCAVLAGRAPYGKTDHIYAHLIAMARQRKVPVFLDSHGSALRGGIKAKPFAIKPNLQEAEEALGVRLNSLTKVKQAVNNFHRHGVQLVIISMAAQGAVVSSGREMFLVQPPAVKVKSQVGCGDSFVAGCVYGLVHKLPLSRMAAFASAVGTANALGTTPGAVKRKTVQQLIPLIKVTAI